MNKDLYKREVNALQNLIGKFTNAQPIVEEESNSQASNNDFIIIAVLIFLLVAGGVGFLTYWLLH